MSSLIRTIPKKMSAAATSAFSRSCHRLGIQLKVAAKQYLHNAIVANDRQAAGLVALIYGQTEAGRSAIYHR
jgi:hypothetical protein